MLLFTTTSGVALDPLRAFRDDVRSGREDSCLLMPTATMAEHIRHLLARQGALVRPDSVVTLSRFIEPYVRATPQASPAALHYLVARRLEKDPPEVFRPLAHSPGLRRMIASLIEEADAAGCSTRLLARRAASPAARAFQSVYRNVEEELQLRSLLLGSERLRIAASRVRAVGHPWRRIYLAGFFSLSPAELEVVDALRPADRFLSLPEWPGAEDTRRRLPGLGFAEQRVVENRPQPVTILIRAANEQEEAEEIARRIAALVQRGASFRDIGVVVRREHPYTPLLGSTFGRFGIPARFYFQRPLAAHPLARYYSNVLDALESGWEYERLLAVIAAPYSGLGATVEGDTLDHNLRTRIPGHGLPRELDALCAIEHWPAARFLPAQWVEEFGQLRNLVRLPAITDGVSHQQALSWRELASAVEAWDRAVSDAAALLDPETPATLSEFRHLLCALLDHTHTGLRDQRRNVVHVLDAYEARQWSLPILFVCGLIERVFPPYHSEHPILGDAERERLRDDGVLLRTSAERQREEEFLFETVTSRASELLALTYAAAGSKGDRLLPSFFLSRLERSLGIRPEPAVPCRPRPLWPKSPPRAARITDRSLLAYLEQARSTLSPTAIESFLQCPFQFFGRYILELESPPQPPSERLNLLLQGDILHRTLAEAESSPLSVGEIFARLFTQACRERAIPQDCRTEKARLELQANLRRFLDAAPLTGVMTRGVEHSFDLRLAPGLRLRGKIDRIVELPQRGLVVIDYKYTTPEKIRSRIRAHLQGELVQGGLYLWAAKQLYQADAAGVLYCGLRGEVSWGGWHLPSFGWQQIGDSVEAEGLRDMMDRAVQASLNAAARIGSGEIAPAPADRTKCGWCEFRDLCRVESTPAGVTIAAGGSSS